MPSYKKITLFILFILWIIGVVVITWMNLSDGKPLQKSLYLALIPISIMSVLNILLFLLVDKSINKNKKQ
ncbi:hypothetical protein KDAU_36810 [Dictyobacter aurantiacus]|uniref:Uncharacterized protein n=1 Tax=Dictyobacter aurantiacus TaxID=1936993 RepID=A0A401ZHM6_9CHLR|nr:hypothetical protein KDAU_36810 [Dictyobacter aurantiacus]